MQAALKSRPLPLDATPVAQPQMFRFQKFNGSDWDYGVIAPVSNSSSQWRATWSYRGDGISLQLPPSRLREMLGEVHQFEWLDHDYEWSR